MPSQPQQDGAIFKHHPQSIVCLKEIPFQEVVQCEEENGQGSSKRFQGILYRDEVVV